MLAYLLALWARDHVSIPDPLGDIGTTFALIVLLMSTAGYSFAYGAHFGRRGALALESAVRSRTRYRRESATTVRESRTGVAFFAPEF